MEASFTVPESRAYLDALAAHTQIVTFDRRGTGASARDVDDLSALADQCDTAAVADAAGLTDFALFSDNAAWPSIRYAIEHQERVRQSHPLDPLLAMGRFRDMARLCREDWSAARRYMAGQVFPDGPVSLQRTFGQNIRDTLTADVAIRYLERGADEDWSLLLPRVSIPTLVLQREARPRQDAMRVAGLLPNGQLRLLPGNSQAPYPEHEPVVKTIFEFMGLSDIPAERPPQGTAIILFADIVDSTALTERIGDAAFREKARALDDDLRTAVRENAGAVIDAKTLGDGILATFPAASQAIAAALACGAARRRAEPAAARRTPRRRRDPRGRARADRPRIAGDWGYNGRNRSTQFASQRLPPEVLCNLMTALKKHVVAWPSYLWVLLPVVTAWLPSLQLRAAEYVIHISVDGLNASMLQSVIEAGNAANFKRLQTEALGPRTPAPITHTPTRCRITPACSLADR